MIYATHKDPRNLGARVFIGGEEIKDVRYAWALWQGGPGCVVVLGRDDDGRLLLDRARMDVAEVELFAQSVRIELEEMSG